MVTTKRVKSGLPLTWDQLATLYDESHPGRRARTLPMNEVFDWAERQSNRFLVSEDGSLYLLQEAV